MHRKRSADDEFANPVHRAPHRPQWLPPLQTTTGVYFIEEISGHFRREDEEDLPREASARYVGPIKIGWARNVHERLPQLQTGNPHWLYIRQVLLLPSDYEGVLHRRFAANHIGGEWFDPSGGGMDHLATAHTIEDALAVKRWLDDDGPDARFDELIATTRASSPERIAGWESFEAWHRAGWEAYR